MKIYFGILILTKLNFCSRVEPFAGTIPQVLRSFLQPLFVFEKKTKEKVSSMISSIILQSSARRSRTFDVVASVALLFGVGILLWNLPNKTDYNGNAALALLVGAVLVVVGGLWLLWYEYQRDFVVVPKNPSGGKTYWTFDGPLIIRACPGRYSAQAIFVLSSPATHFSQKRVWLEKGIDGLMTTDYDVIFRGEVTQEVATVFYDWLLSSESLTSNQILVNRFFQVSVKRTFLPHIEIQDVGI